MHITEKLRFIREKQTFSDAVCRLRVPFVIFPPQIWETIAAFLTDKSSFQLRRTCVALLLAVQPRACFKDNFIEKDALTAMRRLESEINWRMHRSLQPENLPRLALFPYSGNFVTSLRLDNPDIEVDTFLAYFPNVKQLILSPLCKSASHSSLVSIAHSLEEIVLVGYNQENVPIFASLFVNSVFANLKSLHLQGLDFKETDTREYLQDSGLVNLESISIKESNVAKHDFFLSIIQSAPNLKNLRLSFVRLGSDFIRLMSTCSMKLVRIVLQDLTKESTEEEWEYSDYLKVLSNPHLRFETAEVYAECFHEAYDDNEDLFQREGCVITWLYSKEFSCSCSSEYSDELGGAFGYESEFDYEFSDYYGDEYDEYGSEEEFSD